MPRGTQKSKEVVETAPEEVVMETTPEAEKVVVETAPVVETTKRKVATQNPTGKFEKLSHGGKFFLVGKDGRILSAGLESEIQIDDMVKRLNK